MAGPITMNYVLHMTELARWRGGEGDLEPDSLHTHGYVHASPNEHAMLAVANSLHRSATEPFCVLVVDTARLSCEVRWEDPCTHIALDERFGAALADDLLFPHIYGAIPREAVVGVRYLRREPPGVSRRRPTRIDGRGARPVPASRGRMVPCHVAQRGVRAAGGL
ncbi:DUF952 domain-containing protein [Nocardiopsis sp. CNR-923]|uniref:DUF952 domain-containing protein n=1 Tax=Nocardiopsis sp. CNR-923 TaxID=1904965 RepID=UPI0029161EC1|nr:DUF952 domain-containing protein [Nocardiopsis sp. CNR-923]